MGGASKTDPLNRDVKQWMPEDSAQLESFIHPLDRRLRKKLMRKWIQTHKTQRIDIPATIRLSLATDGELLRLKRKQRDTRKPRIYVLVDVSKSMESHAAFFLRIGRVFHQLLNARRLNFFKDPWSVFDFLVVMIAFIPATGSLSVLRALRVLRVLRLINKIESMRRVVGALLSALPGLGSVFSLILIIFYVSAVIATNIFGLDFPERFGSLSTSLYTLFQIMTLEGWSEEIARPVMEVFPSSWIFFILFVLC